MCLEIDRAERQAQVAAEVEAAERFDALGLVRGPRH